MIVYRELSSIEADLGIPVKTLYALSNNLSRHYHPVTLAKENGGTRTLQVPDEPLKRVQRAIADRLLPLQPVSPYATAYRPGAGVVKNARPHVGNETIFKLDIAHFFDSIRYTDVKDKVFPAHRYGEPIRILLTMLCYHGDVLPQGAPTSPAISNIVLYDFDCAVEEYCRQRGITYTRYCDDMTFSGHLEPVEELVDFVTEKLQENGFLLNRKKTALVPAARRQSVTGVVVNEKLNVADSYKRQIRTELHFLEKYGVSSHLQRTGNATDPAMYLQSLLGKINYVLQVCPQNKKFRQYKSTVMQLIKRL